MVARMVEEIDYDKTLNLMTRIGLTISFVFGEAGNKGICWSVDVLNNTTLESFEHPFQANSFHHCIEIALIECQKRGWLYA